MNSFYNMNNNILGNLNPAPQESWISKIQTAGGAMNNSTMLIAVAIVLFVLVGVAYYYFYIIPSSNAMYRANKELIDGNNTTSGGTNDGATEVELLFFYADWCPHSKQAKPIWEDLQKTYERKTINGYTILFTEIDSSRENAQTEKMMDKYNIEGFPTIKLIKNGQVIEFDAKPTKDNLTQFLNTVLN